MNLAECIVPYYSTSDGQNIAISRSWGFLIDAKTTANSDFQLHPRHEWYASLSKPGSMNHDPSARDYPSAPIFRIHDFGGVEGC